MKGILYYILRAYVQLGLRFYFSSYKVYGTENIPKKGAIIFTANHQNAFLDALVIVGKNERITHFLARAEVFKKPFFKWLMSLINMMPIYRIRDGWNTLNNNEEIFKACHNILASKKALLIFPEGNHGFERRLRPLSKGFTRIAFGTLTEQPDLDLKIIPVGINYHNHREFRTRVSIHFGKAIDVQPFYTNSDDHNASLKLRNAISAQMEKLIVHIPEDEYDIKFSQLIKMNPDFSNLLACRDLMENLSSTDGTSSVEKEKQGSFLYYFFRFYYLLPLQLWKIIASRIKDPVMLASIKFSIGIFVFPVFLFLQSFLVQIIFMEMSISLVYFLIGLILPLLINNRA
ncbi:1-acyl-sn-glycerol-3-phosphate acyltransferase [Hyphobacterium sp. CCMP332]|nr:1-acyl-sn-glycerol-3-phosphate acyltransferase [Hyphobacterium sp. CCMP332]